MKSHYLLLLLGLVSTHSEEIDPDPLWHMFGDRVKLTTSTVDAFKDCNECELQTQLQLERRFNTSLIDYSLIFDYASFEQFCAVEENERQCEQDVCDKTIDWSFGLFFCIHNKQQFLKYAPCYAATQEQVDTKCHESCRAGANHKHFDYDLPEGLQDEGIRLFNAKAQECDYESCYLNCQQKIIESYCSTGAPSILLRQFVGNRTQIDFQHSEATFAPNCWALIQRPQAGTVATQPREENLHRAPSSNTRQPLADPFVVHTPPPTDTGDKIVTAVFMQILLVILVLLLC